jgi:KAP family P-loop domain
MAAASTGQIPGGYGEDAVNVAPPIPPAARQESILPATPNDQATIEDTLGFTPYAKALAAFLTHPATEPPLAISIEGEWGSGKSSFIRQLEKQIKELETQGMRPKRRGSLVVKFNPWRHDKEEALWAAFALDFLRQVREQRRFVPRWWCDARLFVKRWSWSLKSCADLIRAAALWLCYSSVPIAVVFFAVFRGADYVRTVVEFLTRKSLVQSGGTPAPKILDWTFRVSGTAGCAALVWYIVKFIKRLVGSPLEVDLQKHLKAPRYEGSVPFVEKLHHDFPKVVDAYAGNRRVYVFVDDLDRCQAPRAAELMQAINLMISDDPRLVFIIGMDWEKVAAGIAVKNSDLMKYLKRSAAPTETGVTPGPGAEIKDEDRAQEFGREFLEKFIQLRFALPRPAGEDIKRLLQTLSSPPSPARKMGFWQRAIGVLASPQSTLARVRGPRALEKEALHKATVMASGGRPKELIEFGVGGDSEIVRDITLALAPAFRNNPRRVKRFLGLFRLRTFIAKETGLLAGSEHQPYAEATTLEQLGKFTALELLWPSLLQEAEEDRGLLTRLEEQALGSRPGDGGWISRPGVGEFLRIGFQKKSGSEAPPPVRWSIMDLEVGRLLRVSPYVGPFDAKIMPLGEQAGASGAPTDDPPPARSFLLQRRRVPFKAGQNADFITERLPPAARGFTLSMTLPVETYWRCGFVLAPEDYIREGREDVTISQYFLFHIGQGHIGAAGTLDPKLPSGLHFRVYERDRSEGEQPFHSESPVKIDVRFSHNDGLVAIGFGDVHVSTNLPPAYLRYLYILAWADSLPACHVAAELTLL